MLTMRLIIAIYRNLALLVLSMMSSCQYYITINVILN